MLLCPPDVVMLVMICSYGIEGWKLVGEKDFFLVQASIVNRRPSISFVPGPKKKAT